MIVFTLTNILSGQVYVGTTRDCPEERWAQLCAAANDGLDSDLYADIRHSGVDNFELKEWAVAEDLSELRQLTEEAIRDNDALSLQGVSTRAVATKPSVIRASTATPARPRHPSVAPRATATSTSATGKASKASPTTSAATARATAAKTSNGKLATGRLSSSTREKKVREAIEQEREARRAEELARQQQQAAEMAAIMARIDSRGRR